MPLCELSRWRAFYSLQPFGLYRDEYLTAQICATIREMAGRVHKGNSPSIGELMNFTNNLDDIAKPGKRISEKVRSVMSGFKRAR